MPARTRTLILHTAHLARSDHQQCSSGGLRVAVSVVAMISLRSLRSLAGVAILAPCLMTNNGHLGQAVYPHLHKASSLSVRTQRKAYPCKGNVFRDS